MSDFSPPKEEAASQPHTTAGFQPRDLQKAPRVHIGFIDALRAIAALYVVAGHIFGELSAYQHELAATYPNASKVVFFLSATLFRHGHLAVAIFIVISGYCLMLPLARKDSMHSEGFSSFIVSRARRILPPYYAALVISLALMAVLPGMNAVSEGSWYTYAVPGFDTKVLISHLFLFHHWSGRWLTKIDPPLWSIGVEWQMYFLMPLFFLPLLRRLGRIGMLVTTALAGIGLTYIGNGYLPPINPYVHFVALFSAGMVAAQICFSPNPGCVALRRKLHASKWFAALLSLIAMLLVSQNRRLFGAFPLIHSIGRLTLEQLWVMDYLASACFCFMLISLCQDSSGGWIASLKRTLHWRPLTFVGHFSYSIYLIHNPALRLICTIGEYFHFTALAQYIVLSTIGLPFSVLCGYLFYLAVERHFIRNLPARSR